MKKILIAIVMVMMLASPAIADAPVNVIVNGKVLNTPGLIINDRTYVPLRAVSEGLGAQVDWDGSQAIVTSVKEPNISGKSASIDRVKQALDLLKEKDPADYEFVCRYVKFIRITDDAKILGNTSTYTAIETGEKIAESICLTSTLFNNYDSIHVASTMVHEATHLCNAHYKNITSNNKADENIAYLRGIATLRILGASQSDIDGTEATRLRVINR